ncbi:MAG TPA: tetratricopeptide repeat protein [Desulfobacterales bacterium]|nr:tetratricopeptide repeat protein [Desulfobacterales bacterium]
MRKHRFPLLPASLIFILLFCCSGCSILSPEDVSPPENHIEGEDIAEVEQTDSACSYFYFLWGVHAENNKRFSEAEEAFEKALICDPDSRYVLRKLPILLIRMGRQPDAEKWLRESIKKYPSDLQDRMLLARLYIHDQKVEEAIELYKEIMTISPDDEGVLLRLGFLYSRQNRFDEAEKAFKQALSVNKDSLFAHLYLARLAIQINDMEQALNWYEKALQINWSVDLALELAEFYGIQKKYADVELQYRSILKKHPEESRAGLGLVQALLQQDNETEALQVLHQLKMNSDDPDQIDIITSRLYLRSGKLDKAVELLEPLAAQGRSTEAVYMLSVIYYQQKKHEQAMELLQTIKPESRNFEDSIYLQVRILMEEQQVTGAIELLKQTIDDKELNHPGFYTLLASLYMDQQQIKKGYAILDKALKRYPDNAQIYFEYGLLLEQDGAQKQAIARMEKVLQLEPDHAEALNYLGYTWADNNINLEKALEYVQRSMRLKPDNGYIQDSLGWVYFRMGKLDQAVQEILKALKLEPSDPHIYEHLGDIYLEQGNSEKAVQAYKKSRKLFKNQADKKRMQEKIDGTR